MNKYLIIRFSSFGDIAQALPSAAALRALDPSAEIHWLTRNDFVDFVKSCPQVDQVWGLERKLGVRGLLALIRLLKKQNFTHAYDAHSNLRSFIVSSLLRINFSQMKFIRRSKNRFKRILLFWFHINLLPKPFQGILSYLEPLKKWWGRIPLPPPLNLNTQATLLHLPQGYPIADAIVIAPSATWELKRWPTEYWGHLCKSMKSTSFILLAGENDTFCDEIIALSPDNILNLRGRISWLQSTHIVSLAKAIVSGDTGLLHIADVLGKPAIAIIGPTAFGFPTRNTSVVAEVNLSCRPCTKDGRGTCHNSVNKKCLVDISPDLIRKKLMELSC